MNNRSSILALLCAAGLSLAAAPSGSETLTQSGWAGLLVDRMALGLPAGGGEQAMALLGTRGTRVDVPGSTAKILPSDGPQKAWRYELATPSTATWLLVVSRSFSPAFVNVDREGSLLTPGSTDGSPSDAGRHALLAGPHSVSIHLAQGTTAPDVALVGGCSVVAPPAGWQAASPLTFGVLARTLLQAMHEQGRLPAAEGMAIANARDAAFSLNVEHEGTYTVLLSGHAFDRASYRLDGCEEVHPLAGPTADGWREGSTTTIPPGSHQLTFYGMDPKGDGRVRLVRRSSTDWDHLAVLAGLGIELRGKANLINELPLPSDEMLARGTGGIRHAKGDAARSLAGETVTRAEAERILDSPAVARRLSASYLPANNRPPEKAHPVEPGGFDTYDIPISPIIPGGAEPQ